MANKKLILPNMSEFYCSNEYVKEFIILNKKRNVNFSYRYMAKKLNWPISYLNEIIKKKRHLSIKRAFQFLAFVNIVGIDAERFLLLVLFNIVDEKEKSYIKNRILPKFQKNLKGVNTAQDKDDLLFMDLEFLAVYKFLIWNKGKINQSKIKELLFTFPDLSLKKCEKILEALIQVGAVKKISEGKYEILRTKIYNNSRDQKNRLLGYKVEKEGYSANYQNFLDKPSSPGTYSSGFIHVPDKELKIIFEYYNTFRNYLYDISNKTVETLNSTSDQNQSGIYQFGLQFFPILKRSFQIN